MYNENTITAPEYVTYTAGTRTDKYYVTGVAPSAFENSTMLKTVTLNNGYMETIGQRAFYNCGNLTTVSTNAASIDAFAFYLCTNISSLTLSEGVKTIGNGAFYQASMLGNLTIPSTVTSIGTSAFAYCGSLKWVTWNAKSCADFGSTTAPFSDMKSVTSVNFGNTVTKIPAYLCYNLNKITSITVPQNVTSIGSNAFDGCTGLTSVGWYAPSIADFTLTTVPFASSTGITSITIPNSVTSIGNKVFYNCTGLSTVNSEINNPQNVTYGRQIFDGVNKEACVLYIPGGTLSLYKATSPWEEFFNIVDPNSGKLEGDLNGDGQVNSADVSLLYSKMVGDGGAEYDLNGDGQINSADVSLLYGLMTK